MTTDLDAWIRKFDLLTLRLFLAVVSERSLNRAAQRQAMTPSAATKRIKALEDGLGARLIERGPRGLKVTAAGEIAARHVRGALEALAELQSDLAALGGAVTGTLTITANASSWAAFLAADIARFSRTYPEVRLELRDAPTPEVIRAVVGGETDVGVCPADGTLPKDLAEYPYRIDRLVAAMSPVHPAAKSKGLTLSELLQYDLIGWSPRGSLMRTLQQAADGVARPLTIRWRMNSIDSARALLRAGLGVAVLPEAMVKAIDGKMTMVPIRENWTRRRLVLLASKQRAQLPLVQALVNQLAQGENGNGAVDKRTSRSSQIGLDHEGAAALHGGRLRGQAVKSSRLKKAGTRRRSTSS